jgi:hypothetical protein
VLVPFCGTVIVTVFRLNGLFRPVLRNSLRGEKTIAAKKKKDNQGNESQRRNSAAAVCMFVLFVFCHVKWRSGKWREESEE